MDLTLIAAATCFILIGAVALRGILWTGTAGQQPTLQSLQGLHRMVYEKYGRVQEQAKLARSAWTSVISDQRLGRPVTVMIEAKMLDRVLERADRAMEIVRQTSKGFRGMPTEDLVRLQSRLLKQSSILNVCQADVELSLSRLQKDIAAPPATVREPVRLVAA